MSQSLIYGDRLVCRERGLGKRGGGFLGVRGLGCPNHLNDAREGMSLLGRGHFRGCLPPCLRLL